MIRTLITLIMFIQCISGIQGQNKAPKTFNLSLKNKKQWHFEGIGEWEMKDSTLIIVKNAITDKPFRVPSARAIYTAKKYGNFELSASIKSNASTEQIRGDIILIFGYQSPSQFYYAHFTGTVDDTHNGIFIVNNTDRKKLMDNNTSPFLPDRDWHNVRLTRNIKTGEIKVFVDGSVNPSLELTDKTFLKGNIGVGSFNDPGEIKDIVVIK